MNVSANSLAANRFCWADLACVDVRASAAFYGELFGWSASTVSVGRGAFIMARLRGREVATLYQLNSRQLGDGAPSHWTPYLRVENVEAGARAAIAAGGRIFVEPFGVGDLLRMTVGQDPCGALIGLWQPGRLWGCRIRGNGAYAGFDLLSRDPEASASFYEAVFGWRRSGAELSHHCGDAVARLICSRDAWHGLSSRWRVRFRVSNCCRAVALAAELGARIVAEPQASFEGGALEAVIEDPQGAELGLVSGGIALRSARVSSQEDIRRWVLGSGGQAEALEPPELRQLVRHELEKAARKYE